MDQAVNPTVEALASAYTGLPLRPACANTSGRLTVWLMQLRLDLLEHLTDQDILEEVLANNHRYKPEPNFSKTGVGTLSSASIEERAQEEARSTARIQRAMRRLKQSGGKSNPQQIPSPKP